MARAKTRDAFMRSIVIAEGGSSAICVRCEKRRTLAKFKLVDHKAGGYLDSTCGDCRYASRKARRGKRDNALKRVYSYRTKVRRYGLTQEAHKAMLQHADGRCHVCGVEPAEGRRLSIDHDHATGKVRGLLCNHCNFAMGLIDRAGIEVLEALRRYVSGERDWRS